MIEDERKDRLVEKLDLILKRQEAFSLEIEELRAEIKVLKASNENSIEEFDEISPVETEVEDYQEIASPKIEFHPKELFQEKKLFSEPRSEFSEESKTNLEKFIGENLINKIGIAITIIGVAIGAKYTIDHQLISPLTRIIIGYLMGFGLLGFGIKLKKNYHNFSAVLVSGAIAIMYFITFFAYSYYALIPQLPTFILMVIFTAFAVVTAIKYKQQVIAHIGLVGAYAVPFLLSDGSGNARVLFSYIALINVGILLIAFKKYWNPLYFSSFIFTWIIFISWYFTSFENNIHFGLSLTFLTVFFFTFYAIILVNKLIRFEKFILADILLLLTNSFIFFSLGYLIIDGHNFTINYLGLFTLCNSAIHLLIAILISRQKKSDRNLFYLIAGLALVFFTIAIPVQLNGNQVTILWAFEAALLFWIGRNRNADFYEMLSYPMMFAAFFSIIQDWSVYYNAYLPEYPSTRLFPIFNSHFLTSALFIGSFAFINFVNSTKKGKEKSFPLYLDGLEALIKYSIPAILLFAVYYSFKIEISTYWNQLFLDSATVIKKEGQEFSDTYMNYDLNRFRDIWVLNYSLAFFTILSIVNMKKIRNTNLASINLGFNLVLILVFLFSGLYTLSELRDNYLNQTLSAYYPRGIFNIQIRYISFVFFAAILATTLLYIKEEFLRHFYSNLKIPADFLLYISVIWVCSSELISWMDILKYSESYKLGLSILWGVYSLLLIILGIWKNKKHLRIGAIGLFAVTLGKLFLYDISDQGTISKTIVFVTLGLLLLVISFLYNKYKHLI